MNEARGADEERTKRRRKRIQCRGDKEEQRVLRARSEGGVLREGSIAAREVGERGREQRARGAGGAGGEGVYTVT